MTKFKFLKSEDGIGKIYQEVDGYTTEAQDAAQALDYYAMYFKLGVQGGWDYEHVHRRLVRYNKERTTALEVVIALPV